MNHFFIRRTNFFTMKEKYYYRNIMKLWDYFVLFITNFYTFLNFTSCVKCLQTNVQLKLIKKIYIISNDPIK